MRIKGANKHSGSVMVGALIFALAIATCLVSYLLLVQNSDQTVARAQQWNSALAIAEAGVEEAMAKLNAIPVTTNQTSTNFSMPQQSLNSGYYNVSVSITNTFTNAITSSGTVHAPITGDLISRTVQVIAARQGLFSKGIVSLNDITLKGNGSAPWAVDSYDSRLGPYNPNNVLNGGGDVAAGGFVDAGNHTINGNLWLTPDGTFTMGPNGGVTGTVYHDWNMTFPDIQSLPVPDANGWQATQVGSDHYFTNSGYYTIYDNNSIYVAPGITVTLDVKTSNFDLNQSTLSISGGTTNSGTLIVYQESGSVTLGGSSSGGAVNNQPKNFVYFGMTGVTSINMGGGSVFVGVIYAPEADLVLNGGGSSNDLMGSFIVNSLTMTGHYSMHYDISLAGYYWGYYVVGSWQELPSSAN
jgi:hypothetical protein